MWNPQNITIENLFSHVNTKYNFTNNKVTLVFGINEDGGEGANSNGAGKSVIAEALCIAITGQSYRNISQEDYIRDTTDKAQIHLDLYNTQTKEKLSIQRVINRKSPSKVKTWINNEEQTQLIDVASVNKFIIDKIGISKDDISNYFIIGQGNDHSFLTATDSTKKRIINRIVQIEHIETKYEEVKSYRKELEKEYDDIEKEIKKCQWKIDQSKEQIKQEKERIEQEKEQKIKDCNSKITQLNDEIDEIDTYIQNSNSRLEKSQSELQELQEQKGECITQLIDNTQLVKELTTCKDKKQKKRKKLNNNEESIQELYSLIGESKSLLSGFIQCPNCGKNFNPSENIKDNKENIEKDIDDAYKAITNLQENNKKTRSSIDKLNDRIDEINDHLNAQKLVNEQINYIEKQINNQISIVDDEQHRINNQQSNKQTYIEKIKKVEKEKQKWIKAPLHSDYLDKLNNQLSIEKDKQKQYTQKSKEIDIEKHLYADVEYHLSREGIQTYLCNKVLKAIEDSINHFLNRFSTNLMVAIDGFTKLRSGKLNDKISISVYRENGLSANLNRYSGGEKNRLQLASILAIQKLINFSTQTGGLNCLFLDETFVYLDDSGQKELLKCLISLDQTILSISHSYYFLDNYDDIRNSVEMLTLHKRNRITKAISS